MQREFIIVKNTPEKNNPALAKAKKIVVLDGSVDAWKALVEELEENKEKAYDRQEFSEYFNLRNLKREFYQAYNEKTKKTKRNHKLLSCKDNRNAKENKKIDKRKLEQNQNITKQYAVSYAIITYDYLHPNDDVVDFAYQMIELMRTINPRSAVKEADKILTARNKKESIK